MAAIRFLSPTVPDLALAGVPAVFVNGVFDVEDTETDRISRLRYLGTPYGVIEMGALNENDSSASITMAAIANAIKDPNSLVGAAILSVASGSAQIETIVDDLALVKAQIASLTDGGSVGGAKTGVGTPATYDASSLPDNTFVVLFTADPSA